ncbi:MAG: hypothetical protein E6K82_27270 [Candidatus Rokuibacteriota bacterium]|nr:MAG: hypothetical protein E6K82_27270 [Candidatus Rokubacteria bacterium]
MIRALVAALIAPIALPTAAHAETKLRVGWCVKTVSSATAPFAIATRLGWYRAVALPSVEPLAIALHPGVKAKVYIKQPVKAAELITNELIADINKFDAAKITAEAKAYK